MVFLPVPHGIKNGADTPTPLVAAGVAAGVAPPKAAAAAAAAAVAASANDSNSSNHPAGKGYGSRALDQGGGGGGGGGDDGVSFRRRPLPSKKAQTEAEFGASGTDRASGQVRGWIECL